MPLGPIGPGGQFCPTDVAFVYSTPDPQTHATVNTQDTFITTLLQTPVKGYYTVKGLVVLALSYMSFVVIGKLKVAWKCGDANQRFHAHGGKCTFVLNTIHFIGPCIFIV